jgi:MFS transporter, SP family, general alpha glucoside:H+ symporter
MQSYILLVSQCGQIVGIYLSGWAIEKFGYRRTIMAALTMGACLLSVSFFAINIYMVLAGELLLGIPWGTFQATTLPYVSDLCPQKLKPILSTGINLCWVFGQLAASGAIKASLLISDDTWAYRMPILCQWVVPPALVVLVFFAPESPYWLVRHGQIERAERVVARLTAADPTFNASGPVAGIRVDNEKEKAHSAGTGYAAVFCGANLRRTEIAVMCNLTQQWCGSHLMFYSAKVYQMGGIPEDTSFTFNLVQYVVAIAGVVTSWFLMKHLGRRTLWLLALSTLFVLLAAVGAFGFFVERDARFSYAAGSLLLAFSLVYNMSVGPVCYSIIAEVPSTRLKAKTGVIARNVYNLAGIFNLFIGPKMLEGEAGGGWGLGVKTALFWAGMCAMCLFWAIWRLPELKDRRPGELEVLFEKKVPATQFAKMKVDQFKQTITLPNGKPFAGKEAELDGITA